MIRLVITLFCCLGLGESGDYTTDNLQSLGKQRPSEGHIDILTEVPSVEDFFEKYVAPGKPVVLKGAAKSIPAFKLWTDKYLRNKFGSVKSVTEVQKKENRSLYADYILMTEFVDSYKTRDIYMVHSIPQNMRDDISLLPCMSCGGYLNVLQNVILWFSSGGTKSVFHGDGVDNINCLFSGRKEFYMVDKVHQDQGHLDMADGSYSSVDVDAVNLTKYPNFAKLPWYEARMKEGDCLFIPLNWLHQVRSYGRNIAVNVWFNHLRNIDLNDCKTNKNKGKYIPMTNITLKPLDGYRNILLLEMGLKKDKQLKKKEMFNIVTDMVGPPIPELFNKVWKILDKNKDRVVTEDELMSLSAYELKHLNRAVPLFDLGKNDENDNDMYGGTSEEGYNNEDDSKLTVYDYDNEEDGKSFADWFDIEDSDETANDKKLTEQNEKNYKEKGKGQKHSAKDEL